MEVCVYVGGVGIQREQILYFSGGGAVLLGEVLRFSSFYSIDCWCGIPYRPQGAPPITASRHRPPSDLCVCRHDKKKGDQISARAITCMKKLIETSVRLWSATGGLGVAGAGAGLWECVWIKVGQREQPILPGEKKCLGCLERMNAQ